MLYVYGMAVVAGFLLTAVKTGRVLLPFLVSRSCYCLHFGLRQEYYFYSAPPFTMGGSRRLATWIDAACFY